MLPFFRERKYEKTEVENPIKNLDKCKNRKIIDFKCVNKLSEYLHDVVFMWFCWVLCVCLSFNTTGRN